MSAKQEKSENPRLVELAQAINRATEKLRQRCGRRWSTPVRLEPRYWK